MKRNQTGLKSAILGVTLLGATASFPALAGNLISNGTFDNNTAYPWVSSIAPQSHWNEADGTIDLSDGRYCMTVTDPGSENWHITLRVEGLNLLAGELYEFSADVWSSAGFTLPLGVTHEPPNASTWTGISAASFEVDQPLAGSPQAISHSFTPTSDYSGAYMGFQVGGGILPLGETLCLDNIILWNDNYEDPDTGADLAALHVNQLGYLTGLTKIATYAVPEEADNPSQPRTWSLMQNGQEVETGTTQDMGNDTASGDYVHTIDFTDFDVAGEDYTIVISEGDTTHTSPAFKIGGSVYSQLKYDALAYFYHNRAGISIDGSLVGNEYARGAGHVDDKSLDTKGCVDGSFECRENIDVRGGWYDAGDHGKYVVNGGISVWTMLNQYERATTLGTNAGDFANGTMAIPEAGNDTPDILDEARWELEWILKMQIPTGHEYAGMVYHKLHDDKWAGPTFNPADAVEGNPSRHIWAPSTAATLNYAAVGAQCYRVFKDINATFAQQCLDKAITAYQAAKSTPYLRSPLTDFSADGGGQYEDLPGNREAEGAQYVQDEYYWAATELYLATSANGTNSYDPSVYAGDMAQYAGHLSLSTTDPQTSMNWAHVSSLGVLSLATVGEQYGANSEWVDSSRVAVIERAGNYRTSANDSAYGVPFTVSDTYWGSNANVMNNMIVMGLARDFSCDDSYLDSMQNAMSYILGRNPVGTSYVTGYGDKAVEHPHHRFWSHSLDSSRPVPPPGVVVGGANAQKDDPVAAGELGDCAPLACYIDDINAYSTNEITINWNTPLAWAAAYLDEAGTGRTPKACGGVSANDGTINVEEGYNEDLHSLNGTRVGEVTYTVSSQPLNGTVVIDSNGIAVYTPGAGFTGSDSFTYTASNGQNTTTGTIEITSTATGLSCSWQLIRDVDQWNGFWEARVLMENNTSSDINGWSMDVIVGPENALGSRWHNVPTYTHVSTDSGTGNSTWTVTDSGWNGSIPVGGNLTYTLIGYDPGPQHWETGHDGYASASIINLGGDCSGPAFRTVDIVNFQEPYFGSDMTFTGQDWIGLHWYNNSGQTLLITDEDGNTFDLISQDGPIRVINGIHDTRMEARVHTLREQTNLDMSPGTHIWTVSTGSGLAEETSRTITFNVADGSHMACDYAVHNTEGSRWYAYLDVTNYGVVAESNWSVSMSWNDDGSNNYPSLLREQFGYGDMIATQISDHEYLIEPGPNAAPIAPGEQLRLVLEGFTWGDAWKVSRPGLIETNSGAKCY